MLYHLQELQNVTEDLENTLREANESYSRYEGINDSFNLMTVEIKFMEQDEEAIKKKFSGLTIGNAGDKILTNKSERLLDKNIKIYESNLNLFAKYNS